MSLFFPSFLFRFLIFIDPLVLVQSCDAITCDSRCHMLILLSCESQDGEDGEMFRSQGKPEDFRVQN